MKLAFSALFVFTFIGTYAQQKEFLLQGRLVDAKQNPVSDAYVVNYRTLAKYTSRPNGVFDAWVLPTDSLIISHVSYFRKVVTAYQVLANPTVQLVLDTVNILQIDVIANEKTDAERAAENIKSIRFDPRPQTFDGYTETERMNELMRKENKVERAAASSVQFLQFSPSEEIGKVVDKMKRRKKSKEYDSTKKLKRKK